MAKHDGLAFVAVASAAVLWGTTGTLQTLLPPAAQPVAVGAFRLLFGAIGLALLVVAHRGAPRAIMALPIGKVLCAGAAIAAYNMLFFWAVREAGVGVGTVVAIGSAPLFATLIQSLQARRLPPPVHLLGQLISVSGVVVLGLFGADARMSLLGLLLGLGAGASYTAYTLITSTIDARIPSISIAGSTFVVAAALSLPVLFLVDVHWASSPQALAILMMLGFVVTGLAYAIYTWGLKFIAASTAVTIVLAEPVTAWVLSILVVGEPASLHKALGAAMIVSGVWLVTRRDASLGNKGR